MNHSVVHSKFDLRTFNTMGVACIADEVVFIETMDYLHEAIDTKSSLFVLGGGSNILLPDTLNKRVLLNRLSGIKEEDGNLESVVISIGGGDTWHDVVKWAVLNGLGGIENLALIPGTVGAAPIQNIGAYGMEIKDVFEGLEAINLITGELEFFSNEQCEFGYRDSIFKKRNKNSYIITKVYLRLAKKPFYSINTEYNSLSKYLSENNYEAGDIDDVFRAVVAIRTSKLPDPSVIGNAGSFFKNVLVSRNVLEEIMIKHSDVIFYPADDNLVKIPTGWLIEKCGWKGKRMGNVGVYEKQALVLVNYGKGTSSEIKNLVNQIVKSVHDKFGILIEKEVSFI